MLEFSLANKYLRKRNLAKVNRLAQVVNDVRDALAKEIALIEKTHGTSKTKKSRR